MKIEKLSLTSGVGGGVVGSGEVGNGVTGAGVVGCERTTSTCILAFEASHLDKNQTPNYVYLHLALEKESVAMLQAYRMDLGLAYRRDLGSASRRRENSW